jgi:hypothetical protein
VSRAYNATPHPSDHSHTYVSVRITTEANNMRSSPEQTNYIAGEAVTQQEKRCVARLPRYPASIGPLSHLRKCENDDGSQHYALLAETNKLYRRRSGDAAGEVAFLNFLDGGETQVSGSDNRISRRSRRRSANQSPQPNRRRRTSRRKAALSRPPGKRREGSPHAFSRTAALY